MAVTDEMVERAAIAIVNCERTHISLEPITSLEHVLPMDRPFVLEEARAALTAALSLPVSNTGEWQPIETVPDEGVFIGWCEKYGPALFYIGHHGGEKRYYDDWAMEIGCNYIRLYPTHWQPLPEAPQ